MPSKYLSAPGSLLPFIARAPVASQAKKRHPITEYLYNNQPQENHLQNHSAKMGA